MIVYISIGNSDDKLTQKEWTDFIADVDDDVQGSGHIHGRWFSAPDVEWQSACWCVEIDESFNRGPEVRAQRLKANLAVHARTYGQDSIAWAEVKETEFLGGFNDEVAA